MTGRIGVAISTTGDEHRMDLLRMSVQHWDWCLTTGDSLFVTVDGDKATAERVAEAVYEWTGSVYRVGQVWPNVMDGSRYVDGRLGVAVNKNTGLELLMDQTQAEHLFLCDDDTWPLYRQSLDKHVERYVQGIPHSMVCWGKNRLTGVDHNPGGGAPRAVWKWPRGVMLYQHRSVVERVGGMDERFGPGGHEHAEWSNRIHNAGLTPAPFCSPASYATRNGMGASALWHAEDMRRAGEKVSDFVRRKRDLTSIRRQPEDWERIDQVMVEQEGSDAYVSYSAHVNGRTSATLYAAPSRGAGGEK